MPGWEAVGVDELAAIPVGEGVVWHPVRRRLAIRAFGVNAYTSDAIGREVVEEHDEKGSGAGGHEELYLVVCGRARFTIDGEMLDAPAGTLVFVSDPAVKRVASSEQEGTLVVAVGGEPGRAYEVSAWEFKFAAIPLLREGRFEAAIGLLEEGLQACPDNAAILYNLACAEAQAGRHEAAIHHLGLAVEGDPKYAGYAASDPDLDSIRGKAGLP